MTRPADKKETRGAAAVQVHIPPVRGIAVVTDEQTENHLANVQAAVDATAQKIKEEDARIAIKPVVDPDAESD